MRYKFISIFIVCLIFVVILDIIGQFIQGFIVGLFDYAIRDTTVGFLIGVCYVYLYETLDKKWSKKNEPK